MSSTSLLPSVLFIILRSRAAQGRGFGGSSTPGGKRPLSYFCSVPLYLFVKITRGPSAYLRQLSTFDFWHIHSIVFDQLIPDIAHYWRREEVRSLAEGGGSLADIRVEETPKGTGWILRATKK